MIILIAESKTMTACDRPVSDELFNLHRPLGEAKAKAVMDLISSLSPKDISDISRLSLPMSIKLHMMAREFPYKRVGQKAIEAFTGVVFKALNFTSLSSAAQDFLCKNVRIISSLYGYLKPDDIIKPYRMDYISPLSPDAEPLYMYWRETVTSSVVEEIKADGSQAVLNLLPADAAKCVDWNLVKSYASVWKVDFKELKEGAVFATPHAGRLKTLRGHLLREICQRRITTPTELLTLSTPMLTPMGTPDSMNNIGIFS